MGQIKLERAMQKSNCHGHAQTAVAILNAIPESVKSKLSSSELGQLMDAMWNVMQTSKRVAQTEIIDEGAVWDERQKCLREIA